jgi:hypothetical protein
MRGREECYLEYKEEKNTKEKKEMGRARNVNMASLLHYSAV